MIPVFQCALPDRGEIDRLQIIGQGDVGNIEARCNPLQRALHESVKVSGDGVHVQAGVFEQRAC